MQQNNIKQDRSKQHDKTIYNRQDSIDNRAIPDTLGQDRMKEDIEGLRGAGSSHWVQKG